MGIRVHRTPLRQHSQKADRQPPSLSGSNTKRYNNRSSLGYLFHTPLFTSAARHFVLSTGTITCQYLAFISEQDALYQMLAAIEWPRDLSLERLEQQSPPICQESVVLY